MAEIEVWRSVRAALAAGRTCGLLAVTDSRGSSPGRRGMLMAVTADGPLAGSIGGGKLEARLVDDTVRDLRGSGVGSRLVTRIHRLDTDDSSGMACGGEQTVMLCPLSPAQLSAVEQLLAALDQDRPAVWSMGPDGWRHEAPGANSEAAAGRYLHHAGSRIRVCLVGGGHVSLALSRLLAWLDFRVLVLEERPGITTFEQNSCAHERRFGTYETLLAGLPEGEGMYAAIMTHCHERDQAVLDILLPRRLGYLGLLGSRAKIRRLLGDRPCPDHLSAPAGVPIHSHTPEEIAVSLAAEMIRRRHGGTL